MSEEIRILVEQNVTAWRTHFIEHQDLKTRTRTKVALLDAIAALEADRDTARARVAALTAQVHRLQTAYSHLGLERPAPDAPQEEGL